jgi:hypothetical protein
MEESTRPEAKETTFQALVKFWRWLWVSPYCRHLEAENAALRADLRSAQRENLELARVALKLKLAEGDEAAPQAMSTRRRPGAFKSFGQAKRVLENQPEPQRSVTV